MYFSCIINNTTMNKLILFITFTLLASISCFSQEDINFDKIEDNSELKSKLISKVESINNISCDFRLTYNDKLSGDKETSSGIYYSILPKQIKWEYKTPSEYSIVFNKKARPIIIDNNEINPYSISSDPNFKILNQIIAQYFDTSIFDSNSYSTTYFKGTNLYLMRIIVSDSKSSNLIQSIELRFNKIDYGLLGIKVNINNMEIITLEFSQRFINNKSTKEEFNN